MQGRAGLILVVLLIFCAAFACCITIREDRSPDVVQPSSPSAFTREEITYFKEVALGYEFSNGPRIVYRWEKDPVRIRVHGNPDEDSVTCLESVIADFNGISPTTTITLGDQNNPDIDLYFAPEAEFSRLLPEYVPGNRGYFYTWYSGDCELTRGIVLISTTGLSPAERCHLIREELTQSMGLARDSGRYNDSIFYSGWTSTTSYSGMDSRVIEMLYGTGIPRCAGTDAVERYFSPAS